MEKDRFFVGNQLGNQLGLLHLFDHCPIVQVEVRSIRYFSFLVVPQLLKLIVAYTSVPYADSALTFPPVLKLHALLPLDVPQPVSL